MEKAAARALRDARERGEQFFFTKAMRVEKTGLVIPPIRGETHRPVWRLEEDWCYESDEYRVTVPKGWESDLASVPWPASRAMNSFSFGITGPLLHDFIYEHGGILPDGSCEPMRSFTRREADDLLRELMRRELVRPWLIRVGFMAARTLGWTHWEYLYRLRHQQI